jgi:hypothetical protein
MILFLQDMHKVLGQWRTRSKATSMLSEHPSKRQRKHRLKKNREMTRQLRTKHAHKKHHGEQQAPPTQAQEQPHKKQGKNIRVVKSDLLRATKENDKLRHKLQGKKENGPYYTD